MGEIVGTEQVRPIMTEDVPGAVDTLVEAFADYPLTRHTIASDGHLDRLRRFQEVLLTRIGMEVGAVWVAGDVDAVAVWSAPNPAAVGEAFAALAPTFVEIAGDRAPVNAHADAAMRPHRPTEPVWFLVTVGVHPDHQGKGWARAVIQPGIDASERDGVPAFLETSTESNVRLYRKLGFEVVAEYVLPPDGPRTWAMIRFPAGPES